MSRSSVSAQCDLVASYMDGVHVKIAEAYKPPRKVCLPAAYNNKLPDISKLTYDFSLERLVFEKMTEWHKVRQANNKARNARLDEKRKKEEESSPPPPPPLPDNVKQMPVTAPVPEPTILTPQPLSLPAHDLQDHSKTNGLNFADFDNDTSSPFDNMELKTINDMEELAQVLQPTSQWAPPARLENILNQLTVNDVPEVQKEEKNETVKSQASDQEDDNENEYVKHRSVSAIMEDLQKQLERPFVEHYNLWPKLESPESSVHGVPKHEESASLNHTADSDLLLNLTDEDQKFAHHLNDMGFPLPRAARAIRDLGGQDNKKVVEYLLTVQSLEEMGIPGDDAEKALVLTHYDQDKAKAYYKNLCTLRDLGFPEDKVSAALLKCNIDRDRALDFLIT